MRKKMERRGWSSSIISSSISSISISYVYATHVLQLVSTCWTYCAIELLGDLHISVS